jgi:hypothetical protein
MAIDEKAALESGDPEKFERSGQRFPLGPTPDAGGACRGDSSGQVQVSTRTTAGIQAERAKEDQRRAAAMRASGDNLNHVDRPLPGNRPGSHSR